MDCCFKPGLDALLMRAPTDCRCFARCARDAYRSSCSLRSRIPTRSADVVSYLGLDGVVHQENVLWHPKLGIHMSPYEAAGHTLFEWLPILEEALDPFPAVALVLSSTWCIRPGYNATLKRFPPSLRSRFIGGTYHKRVHGVAPWNQSMFCGTPRGVQIQEDAQRALSGQLQRCHAAL